MLQTGMVRRGGGQIGSGPFNLGPWVGPLAAQLPIRRHNREALWPGRRALPFVGARRRSAGRQEPSLTQFQELAVPAHLVADAQQGRFTVWPTAPWPVADTRPSLIIRRHISGPGPEGELYDAQAWTRSAVTGRHAGAMGRCRPSDLRADCTGR